MEINTNLNVSSEEKLLELLRKQDQGKQGRPVPAAIEDERSKKKIKKQDFPFLKYFNRLMIILGFGMLVIFIVLQFRPVPAPSSLPADETQNTPEDQSGAEDMVPGRFNKPFSFYEDMLKTRDIFASPQEISAAGNVVEIPYVEAINGRFILVGLIIDQDPQAMIEDGQTGQTIFLKINESVSGLKLLDIQEGKIMVDYQGQISELFYKQPDNTPNAQEFTYE